ncbi:GntR family transcriptional regulator [Brevundimonas sp. BAL450]|uniref:GntR family transcriptional regulator n=1 Tax=Brevundimonas sp. BAL450 TaxID=1708162 RepID=UPI0018C9EA3A|nr:GntR family transcriptional regulator [Brevundimonas sp. BAL450]MBG7614679.1 GntR family transcriptional regulator [Brevundimonas sp. BAL450]
MRTRDSFGEAMGATWRVCLSEPVRAGDPLVVRDIAQASRLSATPVREALAWLAGQGLVERRVGRGYFMPDPSAEEVKQLYDLHRRCLLWALETLASPQRLEPAPDIADLEDRTAWLFRCVAASSGNVVLAEAQGRAAARLRLLRRAESQVCPSEPALYAEAEAAFFAGEIPAVRRLIDGHHEARIGRAGEICAALRPAAKNIDQI